MIMVSGNFSCYAWITDSRECSDLWKVCSLNVDSCYLNAVVMWYKVVVVFWIIKSRRTSSPHQWERTSHILWKSPFCDSLHNQLTSAENDQSENRVMKKMDQKVIHPNFFVWKYFFKRSKIPFVSCSKVTEKRENEVPTPKYSIWAQIFVWVVV